MYSRETLETVSFLPLAVILVPAVAAAAVAIVGDRNEKLRDMVAFIGALATFGIVSITAYRVLGGNNLYLETPLLEVGKMFSLKFRVDAMGALFALITALVWTAALAHAVSYMSHEEKRTRFFTFVMVTEAATLGVFLVHDFFSLFIFFELMGLAAYFLVVHSETDSAKAAASKYLYMTVAGGLCLLMGIFLYSGYAGTVDFIPLEGSPFLSVPLKTAALVFFIIGFGVKAGLVPFHVWLPDAHPAAPSPASALLSGVMIKAGAYGILRVITSFFYSPFSREEAESAAGTVSSLSLNVQLLGFVLIWVAVVTMFTGMVLAVIQSDIKRTLAYSSVSQMGFILLGAGCLAYLGKEGAIGLTGSLYHILSHALIKACLFLIAGSILYRTHELNMFRLDGLYRKMPLTTVFWCVAALGIMGIPPFNGFISKTWLHDAFLEASHLARAGALSQAFWLGAAEVIFVISAAGTVLYFLKMTYYTFFRPAAEGNTHHHKSVTEAPAWMLGGTAILAIGILATGIFPNLFLQYVIGPALAMLKGLDIRSAEHVTEFAFFTWENIREVFIPLILGTAAFAAALYLGIFERNGRARRLAGLRLPVWFSFDYWYITGARGLVSACALCQQGCHYLELALTGAVETAVLSLSTAWKKLSPSLSDISSDIALGTLAIAISLALLLVLQLV